MYPGQVQTLRWEFIKEKVRKESALSTKETIEKKEKKKERKKTRTNVPWAGTNPEVRIYKRKQSKKRKHAFDQESDQEKKTNGQEIKKENTLLTKKKRKTVFLYF